jgi:hypothetical protein
MPTTLRNTFRTSLLIILAVLLCSCARHESDQRTIEDIRETVFLYQFGARAGCYCISVGDGNDPSKELMQRFINHEPTVKMRSECKRTSNQDHGHLIDQVSGNSIIFYNVHSVKSKLWKRAEADGSWARGPLHGEAHRYFLKYENGQWNVIGQELLAIS